MLRVSAIFGILRFDGGQVSGRDLDRMGNALAQRGPDGRKFVVKGCVGLGHCLMLVNQEDVFEAQPLYDSGAEVTLVADLRLDNREELAKSFGIGAIDLRDMPDSALVLRAYRTWGEDCAEHLLGDFAFALWDGRAKKLVLARDHMGQRQVVYHHGDQFLAFATEQKALWSLPDVPQVISKNIVGRMLVLDQNKSPGVTLFERIFGLPGGTVLSAAQTGIVNSRRYWEPHADPAHVGNDEAYYVEAYRRVLGEAVACRLRRATGPAGLSFSGGFDSAAIAALAGPVVTAQGRKLIAVSSVAPTDYSGPSRQARPWAELCRRHMPYLDVRYATREGRSIFTGLEKAFMDGFPTGPQHYAHDEIYGVIAAAGARIAMDGHGGDYTLNPRGQFALARFLATGQWRRFVSEFGPWRRHRRQTVLQTIKADIAYVLALAPLISAWRRYRSGSIVPITAVFARETIAGGAVPFGSFAGARRSSMRLRIEQILRQQQNLPQASRAAAGHGLHFTRPFHDKRVVELGLAIPEDLYIKAGRPRALTSRVVGESLGEPNVTLLTSEMPMHIHGVFGANPGSGAGAVEAVNTPSAQTWLGASVPGGTYSTATPTTNLAMQAISIAGGSLPHENMQPCLAMNYCISLEGVFPSRG